MPIEFECESCHQKLRVSDSAAGKRGKCKQCGHLNTIPSASTGVDALASSLDAEKQTQGRAAAGSQGQATPKMYNVRSSVNNSVFGPANKELLKQWLSEGRITAKCHIQKVDTDQWIEASKFFPTLSGEATAASPTPAATSARPGDPFSKFSSAPASAAGTDFNPYQSSTAGTMRPTVEVGDIQPQTADIGEVISRAFDVWKENFGLLLGAYLASIGIYIAGAFVVGIVTGVAAAVMAGNEAGMFVVAGLQLILSLVNMAVSIWLFAGMLKIQCALGRGQQAEFSDLFTGGSSVLPLLGMYLLVLIPMSLLVGLFVGGAALIGQGDEVSILIGVGCAALASCALGLLLWPIPFLVVDRKMFFDAIGTGFTIASKNILQILVIGMVAFFAVLVGYIACFVGAFATFPLAQQMMVTAYLSMSGQVRSR